MSQLFYIIGASGAGKDSLMNFCRDKINGALPIVFAHRYITRPAGAGNENHVSLTVEEFQLRLKHGLFALHWESHGLHYGIGIEINNWLQQGLTVVINGSREYLDTATERYPAIIPVLITADPTLLQERLNSRGRENDDSIAERIARNHQFNLDGSGIMCVQNNGSLQEAADELMNVFLSAEKFIQQS